MNNKIVVNGAEITVTTIEDNPVIFSQYLHLADGDGIEFGQSLCLGHTLIDEHRIQVFQIGQTHKLRDVGVVPNIAFEVRVGFAPFLCGHAKQRHVQNICFIGIDQRNLSGGQCLWDEIFLDSIGMYPVIDLGEISLDIPAKLFHLLGLEPFKLLDQIDFELRADPHTELEGNVLVGICPAVSSSLRFEANRTGLFYPLLDTEFVAVQTSLTSNYGEFAIIKIGIVDLLPDSKELNSVSISQPV